MMTWTCHKRGQICVVEELANPLNTIMKTYANMSCLSWRRASAGLPKHEMLPKPPESVSIEVPLTIIAPKPLFGSLYDATVSNLPCSFQEVLFA